jgi:hypothetical protein
MAMVLMVAVAMGALSPTAAAQTEPNAEPSTGGLLAVGAGYDQPEGGVAGAAAPASAARCRRKPWTQRGRASVP